MRIGFCSFTGKSFIRISSAYQNHSKPELLIFFCFFIIWVTTKKGCDHLFEIETEKTYQKDHMKMIYEAQEEIQKEIQVAVKALPESWESYDPIFLGYSNWWNTLPMPVISFAEQLNFTGKRVFPFCTNEGSGVGNSVEKLRELCAGAVVEDGISIRGSQAASSQEILSNWVKRSL